MGQSRPSQLARILLSREAESKYPPPKNKHTKISHTNRCGKNGEEIGSLLYYYYYSNPISTTASLSIFSNPNANIQTPLFFPLPLSLSTIRTLLRIHLLRRLHSLFFPRNCTTPVLSSSSPSLRSFRCTPSLVGDLEAPRGLCTSA